MKSILKFLLKYYLKLITKIILFFYKPKIVVIAGSVNKAFIKERIKNHLEKRGESVRANPKNFNTEIGLPLAILNLPSAYGSYLLWPKIMIKVILKIFEFKFPKYLVLELGVSDRGDMKYLLSIVKPSVVIITDITKRYMESFKNTDSLLKEYRYLIDSISKKGAIIINNDNNKTLEALKDFKAKKISYGIDTEADWQAIEINKNLDGQAVKVLHNNIIENYNIKRFGRHHVYALLAELAFESL